MSLPVVCLLNREFRLGIRAGIRVMWDQVDRYQGSLVKTKQPIGGSWRSTTTIVLEVAPFSKLESILSFTIENCFCEPKSRLAFPQPIAPLKLNGRNAVSTYVGEKSCWRCMKFITLASVIFSSIYNLFNSTRYCSHSACGTSGGLCPLEDGASNLSIG